MASSEFLKIFPTKMELRESFARVLDSPKPRRVRLTWRAVVGLVVFILAPGILLLVFHWRHHSGRHGSNYAIIAWVFALLGVLMIVQVFIERGLLKYGDVTVGRVVAHHSGLGSARSGSDIFYAFVDDAGHGLVKNTKASVFDFPDGMKITVYYDPGNPSKSLLYESSLFCVELP